jgi:hypothetical protein
MRCPCNLCLTKPICKGLYDKDGKEGLIKKCKMVREYLPSYVFSPKYYRRKSKNLHKCFKL